jgi:hypothetical protein
VGFRSPLNGLPPSSITADMLEDGAVTGSKLSADAIDGKVITGSHIRTGATGRRLEFGALGRNAIEGYSGAADELAPSDVEMFNNGLRIRANQLDGGPSRFGAAQLLMDYESQDGGATWDGVTYLRGGGLLVLDSYYDSSADPATQVRAAISVDVPEIRMSGDVKIGSRSFEWTPITLTVGTGDGGSIVVEDNIDVGGMVRVSGETWHRVGDVGEPAFENGYSEFNPCRFRRDSSGVVHLHGTVNVGTDGAAMFTLPPGYEPSAIIAPTGHDNTLGIVQFICRTNGQVACNYTGAPARANFAFSYYTQI